MKKSQSNVIQLKHLKLVSTPKKPEPKKKSPKQTSDSKSSIFQLRISLNESDPLIWRRILIAGDANLGYLHAVIQIAMGWTNSHLHQFNDGATYYTDPDLEDDDFIDEPRPVNEFTVLISDLLSNKDDLILYCYDFGDSWDHSVVLEKILKEHSQYTGYPVCLDGERACPPEDCGGVSGYADLCDIMEDPDNDEYDEMLNWLGGSFDPDAFDVKRANIFLEKVTWKKPSWRQIGKILEERDRG